MADVVASNKDDVDNAPRKNGNHAIASIPLRKAIAKTAQQAVVAAVSSAKLGADLLRGNVKVKEVIRELVGGIQLSLMQIDFETVQGLHFDPVRKNIVMICKNAPEASHASSSSTTTLSAYDSILKQDECNRSSLLMWQHFCACLNMFNECGDRDHVSFSLDPAEKLGQAESIETVENVPMKKVYFPDHLRWSKAGEVMFDADYFIKSLLYDLHPDITNQIPGFTSYVQRIVDNIEWPAIDAGQDAEKAESAKNPKAVKAPSWHRLWIVLDELQQTEDEHSVLIHDIKFKINVRGMSVHADGKLRDNEEQGNDDRTLLDFVDHLNDNLGLIEKHSLFLQRLRDLFRALLMAKFVYAHNIPFNTDIVREICSQQEQELRENGIAFELPSLLKTVETFKDVAKDDHIERHTHTDTFCGGINLSLKPPLKSPQQTDAEELKVAEEDAGSGTAKQVDVASLRAMCSEIQTSLDTMQSELQATHVQFQKICDIKNQKSEQLYSAVLLPSVLIDDKNARTCDMEECAAVLAWSTSPMFERQHFCDTHYQQHRYATCTKCAASIDKEVDAFRVMKPTGQSEITLHSQCCHCFYCDARLGPKICVRATDENGSIATALYCSQKCGQKAARFGDKKTDENPEECVQQCMKCKTGIHVYEAENFKTLNDGTVIHDECMVCDECGTSITDAKFIMNAESKLFCSAPCADKQNSTVVSAGMANMVCAQCNQAIDAAYIQLKENMMVHPHCLKCRECEAVIKDANIILGDNGAIFCSEKCAKIESMKCSQCQQDINGQCVRFGDSIFVHSECVKCVQCQQLIESKDEIIFDADQRIFCGRQCLNKKRIKTMITSQNLGIAFDEADDVHQAVECHKCKENLLDSQQAIVCIGKHLLHQQCTMCFSCAKAFDASSSIVTDADDNLFCSAACGKTFHD